MESHKSKTIVQRMFAGFERSRKSYRKNLFLFANMLTFVMVDNEIDLTFLNGISTITLLKRYQQRCLQTPITDESNEELMHRFL